MAQKYADTSAEMRDTVVKSSFTGVAATVLAVTVFSPAGLGGVIGTSLASSFGGDNSASSTDSVYGSLPAFPSPLTSQELDDIRSRLSSTAASLEFTRAATDERIERIRSIAASDGVVTMTPMASVGQIGAGLSSPAPVSASVEVASHVAVLQPTAQRDANMELAALLLAHENI